MIDAWAHWPHYVDHLAPVWNALPDRGAFRVDSPQARREAAHHGIDARISAPVVRRGSWLLVAGGSDLIHADRGRGILVEHGAGQTYEGADHPGYAGGSRRERAGLFLCPRQDVADANLARYPNARAEVVGAPHVEHLAAIPRDDAPADTLRVVVAMTPTVRLNAIPETHGAWSWIEGAVLDLARDPAFEVRVHAHPRSARDARSWAHARADVRMVVPLIERLDDVVRWADVFVVDNSSAAFELAYCGIDVVLLWPPHWRRDIHGGRFGDWARVGPECSDPADLARMVEVAVGWPEREWVAREVFPLVDGSAERAAAAISSAVESAG